MVLTEQVGFHLENSKFKKFKDCDFEKSDV